MTRTRNATEFRLRVDEVASNWNANLTLWAKRQQETGQRGAPTPEEQLLEEHGRKLLVEPILAVLNWEDSNLIPEHSLKDPTWSHPSRMDLFGGEMLYGLQTNPLLVVEVKRPSDRYPPVETWDTEAGMVQLLKYVRTLVVRLGRLPKRIVRTNGLWWIVISVPQPLLTDVQQGGEDDRLDDLREDWRKNPHSVVTISGLAALATDAAAMFRLLDFYGLCDSPKVFTMEEASLRLDASELTHRAWGIRLDYAEGRVGAGDGPPAHRPAIAASPFLMLRRVDGAWFRVVEHRHGVSDDLDADPSARFRLPKSPNARPEDSARLGEHLGEIEQMGDRLLGLVEARLPGVLSLVEMDLLELAKIEGTRLLPSLAESRSDGDPHWVVTGRSRHLIVLPSMPECQGHSAASAHVHWGQSALAVGRPRARSPRSFHPDGHLLHCAQHEVTTAKATAPLAAASGGGLRRSADTEFCRIFPLEARMCCRTCVLHEVCSTSTHLRLPCQRP